MDENTPDVTAFAKTYQANFPVGTFEYMAARAYVQLSPVVRAFVPYMLFIDRKGMIQAQYTGGDEFLKNEDAQEANIRGELAKLLAQPKSVQAKAHKK